MEISEVFHSIQGEGVNTGRWATFVRFSGCNLACSWCDTKYAQKGYELDVDAVVGEIIKNKSNLVVFTGGEPLLQQSAIRDIYSTIVEGLGLNMEFAVETNGLLPMDFDLYSYIDHAAISPKLSSACSGGYLVDTLMEWLFWNGPSSMEFKFVVCGKEDLNEVEWLVERLHLRQSTVPVILQPNGLRQDYSAAARELVELVRTSSLCNYARIMLQSHRVIWEGERGK